MALSAMTMRDLRQQDNHRDSEQDERHVACGAKAGKFFWRDGCRHQVEQQCSDEAIDGGEDGPAHANILRDGSR